MDEPTAEKRCGFIAIVGRPNVGKSTLLNRILGQKISITSSRPQTTRYRILGIKTLAGNQAIYVDTPGLHLKERRAINRYLNRAASAAIRDVDVVVFLVNRLQWTAEDELVLGKVKAEKAPVILAVNKVDKIGDKTLLLPHLQRLAKKADFIHIVPLSALRGQNVEVLEQRIMELLPYGQHFFPADQLTDRSERFLAAELVREKLTLELGQELPYALTVEIESFLEQGDLVRIDALIWVERQGQKGIIVGKGGRRLKSIGMQAREEMEQLFGSKVYLRLWVKVKEGWSDDERALRSLGYTD